MSRLVHYCNFSSNADIKILCTGKWTIPLRRYASEAIQPIPDVFMTEELEYYTFKFNLVTCDACIRACRQ